MRSRVLLALLLLTGSALTGCIGSDDEAVSSASTPAPESGIETTSPAPDGTALDGSPAQLPVDVPLEATRTFEGTFEPQDACVPAACAAGMATGPTAHRHHHAIGDLIPVGAFVDVNVTLTDDAGDGAGPLVGEAVMWIETPAGQVTERREEGVSTDLLQRAPGPATIVVEHYFAEPDQPSVNYELTVQTSVRETQIPEGVPIGVDLSGLSQAPTLTTEQGSELLFSVWGPDGEPVGRFTSSSGTAQVPVEETVEGEIVLLVHRPHASPAELVLPEASDGPDPSVRVVETQLVEGDVQRPSDDGTASWSFETDRAPAAVGISIEMGQTSWKDGIDGLAAREDSRVEITGPNGTVLSSSDLFVNNCIFCYPPRNYTFHSTPGEPDLLPGSYEVEVEGVYGDETELTHRVVTFER